MTLTAKPFMIGLAGPTCAGKSTLAARLQMELGEGNTAVIGLDSYYRDLSELMESELESHSFDQPESFDVDLLRQHMQALAWGEEIMKPVYLYPSHKRAPMGDLIRPEKFIIVEGLFALYWQDVRQVLDAKVFIDTPDQTCLERRLRRDPVERQFTEEFVHHQYVSDVRPKYDRYVAPTRRYADLILNGENSVEASILELISLITKKCI